MWNGMEVIPVGGCCLEAVVWWDEDEDEDGDGEEGMRGDDEGMRDGEKTKDTPDARLTS